MRFLLSIVAVLSLGQAPAAGDRGVELWAICREGVKATEIVKGLEALNPITVEAVDECIVHVVFSEGNEQELREKVAMSFGVGGVTDVDVSKGALATTVATGTVPRLPDATSTTTGTPTSPENAETTSTRGAVVVLGAIGILAALSGGWVLLRDVKGKRKNNRDDSDASRDVSAVNEPDAILDAFPDDVAG